MGARRVLRAAGRERRAGVAGAALLLVVALVARPAAALDGDAAAAEATALLQRYLRIDTSNPPGDVTRAAAFLKDVLVSNGIAPLLTSGATDSRFFRRRGVPAYGMLPVVLRQEDLACIHGVDERISVENLRRATVGTYEIVRRLVE